VLFWRWRLCGAVLRFFLFAFDHRPFAYETNDRVARVKPTRAPVYHTGIDENFSESPTLCHPTTKRESNNAIALSAPLTKKIEHNNKLGNTIHRTEGPALAYTTIWRSNTYFSFFKSLNSPPQITFSKMEKK